MTSSKDKFDPTMLDRTVDNNYFGQPDWDEKEADWDEKEANRWAIFLSGLNSKVIASLSDDVFIQVKDSLQELYNSTNKWITAYEKAGDPKLAGANLEKQRLEKLLNLTEKRGATKEKAVAIKEKKVKKLAEIRNDIIDVEPAGNDMAFTHSVLCQVGLPRSKVDGEWFERRSGDTWLSVQAGKLDEGAGPVLQQIPYGSTPRLALAWVSTYAKRHNSKEIPLGESAAEFLRLMGMDSQGARYVTLRKQMHALAACRLQMGFKGRSFNQQIVKQFDAWASNKGKQNQRSFWPGTMVLTDDYYSELILHGVPLDNRALQALKGSAFDLDVYCWLAHRLHRIEGNSILLYWKSVREQFAQEYTGKNADKDFKKTFLASLKRVLAVYPKGNVKQVTGGIALYYSPPPVPYLK
jgi:hypothetical protein